MKKNIHIVNWYHAIENDPRLKLSSLLNNSLDYIITPSEITKKKLIDMGFQKEKIEIIPLGVNLKYFRVYSEEKKSILKKKYNLPNDKIIIGSFQKDGVGWGDGLKPKLEKGPDIFCEVVKKLHEKIDLHVFLTGPSRGFIKNKLKEYDIPFTHIYLKDFYEIVDCYNTLDLYIVSSRIEGGPLALIECMATGIPIVTTNVGMASLVIKNGINGLIAEVNNVEQLTLNALKILKNKDLHKLLVYNGLKEVLKYNWKEIAIQHYNQVYKKFLNSYRIDFKINY